MTARDAWGAAAAALFATLLAAVTIGFLTGGLGL